MPVKKVVSGSAHARPITGETKVRRIVQPGFSVPGRHYLHVQDVPSSLWTVSHGLGTLAVVVFVYDEDWQEMDASVVVVDANTVHVVCNPPLSGYAVVSG